MKPNWIQIDSVEQLQNYLNDGSSNPKLFFKHSTRCSISSMALKFFESDWSNNSETECYFIDLIAHRDVSNTLAELTKVQHESPQVIVLKNNQVIYSASHHSIDADKILKTV